MWRYYIARKLWKYRALSIILGGTICGAVLTLLACASLSEQPEQQLYKGRPSEDAITVTGPAGITWRVEGLGKLVEPMLREAKIMNKQEAEQHSRMFPEMSNNPEDYLE